MDKALSTFLFPHLKIRIIIYPFRVVVTMRGKDAWVGESWERTKSWYHIYEKSSLSWTGSTTRMYVKPAPSLHLSHRWQKCLKKKKTTKALPTWLRGCASGYKGWWPWKAVPSLHWFPAWLPWSLRKTKAQQLLNCLNQAFLSALQSEPKSQGRFITFLTEGNFTIDDLGSFHLWLGSQGHLLGERQSNGGFFLRVFFLQFLTFYCNYFCPNLIKSTRDLLTQPSFHRESKPGDYIFHFLTAHCTSPLYS